MPGILVCSNFLISVCMFIAHIECYSDCSHRRGHSVDPFAHCRVMCFVPMFHGVFGMFAVR